MDYSRIKVIFDGIEYVPVKCSHKEHCTNCSAKEDTRGKICKYLNCHTFNNVFNWKENDANNS